MRLTLILLTVFGLLVSCGQTDTTTVIHQSDTAANKTDRQVLIEELKRLQAVFVSNDKEKIADIFSFPISNETVGIYIDDSTFNAQIEKNDNKVTRAMFIRFYSDISESLQINQINQLFKKLNIDNLLHKDMLEHEAIIKAEPCYQFYRVKIQKDLVTLTAGTNSNEDYESKSVSEDETPQNDSSICEHMFWWVFKFDGKLLHFIEISSAG